MPVTRCPGERSPDCYATIKRHDHDYKPPPDTNQRCTCGHRLFKLTAGGPLPPTVTCRNCATQNRTATAFERGRASTRPAPAAMATF